MSDEPHWKKVESQILQVQLNAYPFFLCKKIPKTKKLNITFQGPATCIQCSVVQHKIKIKT